MLATFEFPDYRIKNHLSSTKVFELPQSTRLHSSTVAKRFLGVKGTECFTFSKAGAFGRPVDYKMCMYKGDKDEDRETNRGEKDDTKLTLS